MCVVGGGGGCTRVCACACACVCVFGKLGRIRQKTGYKKTQVRLLLANNPSKDKVCFMFDVST